MFFFNNTIIFHTNCLNQHIYLNLKIILILIHNKILAFEKFFLMYFSDYQ